MVHRRSLVGFAALLVAVTPGPAGAQESVRHGIVFDTYMSPAAGAEGLLTIQHLLASAEDRWLPRKIGQERSRPALALGILYRTGKFMALDMPQDHVLMVVAHEVFGHGARFRELGEGRIRYGFDAPIPYGSGDAFTSFRGEFPSSPLGMLNVSASGIEAQHALADAITTKAVERGRIHYREAWLYFESRITGMTYILTASPHSAAGHDVADYLKRFDEGCTSPCVAVTRRYVQRRALLALGDPLLYYAIYGLAVSYIGAGNTTGPVPLIPVGRGIKVLPSLGFALAPYGTEWNLRTALQSGQPPLLVGGSQATSYGEPRHSAAQPREGGRDQGRGKRVHAVTLRIGNTGASTTLGVGVRAAQVLRLRGLPVDVAVDLWRQPRVLADKTSDPLHTGAGANATIVVPLPRPFRSQWVAGIHVTAGYKSEGFIPGEQLSGGMMLRIGMGVQ
jgi:hypothetical protein